MSSERTSKDIEREIEATRSEMQQTIEAIREEISPGQLLDRALSYLKGGTAGSTLGHLSRAVSENPLPLAVTGVGLAWLIYSDQQRRAWQGPADPRRQAGEDDTTGSEGDWRPRGRQVADAVRRTSAGLGATAAGIGSKARDSWDKTRQQASSLAGRARDFARDRAAAVPELAHQAEEHPLVVAALGVALGAAVGGASQVGSKAASRRRMRSQQGSEGTHLLDQHGRALDWEDEGEIGVGGERQQPALRGGERADTPFLQGGL